jgi:hypothetical protein
MISHPLLLMAAVLLAVCPAQGVELKTETAAAFDHYVRLSEQRMQHDLRSGRFLWMDGIYSRREPEADPCTSAEL